MNKYGLHGSLKAQTGKAEELAAILIEASQLLAAAPGCHIYLISTDHNQPNTVWITEAWDSKEDHDNSLKMDSVRALIGRAIPLLDGNPEKGQELEILGGIGIVQ